MTDRSALIDCDIDDRGVADVRINVQTMAPAFFGAVGEVFRELAEDDALRVVVVRSTQKVFTYGLDLPATFQQYGNLFVGAATAGPRAKLRQLIRRWQADFDAIARCPVPVIAAIHGWCIGGGLDLTSACDIRLASADAKISLRETRVAIVADLGTLQRLPAIVGLAKTRELAYTGRDITADEALACGLINAVHPDREALYAAAEEMAAQIAANPPLVVRGVKQVLDYGADKSIEDGLEYVAAWNSAFVASEDLGEAVSAFLEKREPRYTGR